MKLQKITQKVSSKLGPKFGKATLMLKQKSPEILIGVGIIGVGATAFLASKATLQLEGILDEKEDQMKKVNLAKDEMSDDVYSEEDYQKDVTIVYAQSAMKVVKAYAPAVTVGAASIGCLLGAHNIMKRRNVAIAAAYKMLEKGFDEYRGRVVDELGADKDRQFRYNTTTVKEDVIEEDEKGNKKVVKKEVQKADPNGVSVYAKFFDETSTQWSKTPEYNHIFIKGQQNYANDLLRSRGHIFLNEVYDMLGLERTQAGAVVGWVLGEGDDYVDFNLYSKENADFINGHEMSILLDFNVAGVIYDLI